MHQVSLAARRRDDLVCRHSSLPKKAVIIDVGSGKRLCAVLAAFICLRTP